MPMRLLLARREADVTGSVDGEQGQRVLRISGTHCNAADAAERFLKRKLAIRIDDIRSVEDAVAGAQRQPIAGAPRQADSRLDVFVVGFTRLRG